MMAIALWFVGLLALLVATLVASARARAEPADVVGRGVIGCAAIAYVGITIAAVWTWGGATAAAGRARQLHEGALVRLELTGVRVPLNGPVVIGRGRDAAIQVPGAADGPAEIARIEPASVAGGRGAAPRGVVVRGAVLAVVHGADAAAVAAARGCAASDAGYALLPGAEVAAIECAAGRPVRAYVVRMPSAGGLVVTPLAWRGRFVAEQITARAGDALRVGGGEAAIAGLTTWDVIAPYGAQAMLALPGDPSDCAAWLPDASGQARRTDGGCAIETGAFVVAATPLLPDAAAVVGRGLRAALAIAGPPLGLLVMLALAARRDRRNPSVARALRLCVLGASLTALVGWRLLWATMIRRRFTPPIRWRQGRV